eukprot:8181902-Alexandrium_andersonii.AAC.1
MQAPPHVDRRVRKHPVKSVHTNVRIAAGLQHQVPGQAQERGPVGRGGRRHPATALLGGKAEIRPIKA